VIYNKNGDIGNEGIRFHLNKNSGKLGNVYPFVEYFDNRDRLLKLRKINVLNLEENEKDLES
jgi:hypothetical protein